MAARQANILIVILFSASCLQAQSPGKTDSIYQLLLESPTDTNLIHSLNSSISNLAFYNNDTALYYAIQQDSLSILAGFPHGRAMAVNLQGVSYEIKGDLQKAINRYLEAARISEEHKFQYTLSNVLNNLGIVYSLMGAYETSLDYHFKSLRLAETLEDSSKIAVSYNNIGLRLSHLNQESRAVENYKKALAINLDQKRFRPVSANYINLGRAYVITKKFDSAIYFYREALAIFDAHLPNSIDKALVTNGLGYAYIHLEVLDSARLYMRRTRDIAEATNDFYGKLDAVILEGEILKIEDNHQEARKSLQKALKMSEEAELVSNVMSLSRDLAEVSHELGEDALAFEYFLRHTALKDSLFNVTKMNEIANLEFTYQVDRQARIDSLNQVQAEKLRIEIEQEEKYLADRRNALEYSGIALFALLIFLIILVSRRINMRDQVLNLLIFIFFLIIFEASLVAFDPLVDRVSNGEVLIKVLFNSVLAFTVFTAHHFLEGRMNRFIRNK